MSNFLGFNLNNLLELETKPNVFSINIEFDLNTNWSELRTVDNYAGSDQSVIGEFNFKENKITVANKVIKRELITKVISHELFHSFGLGHCYDKFCLMYVSSDNPNATMLCDKCYTKFCKIVSGKLEPELPIESRKTTL